MHPRADIEIYTVVEFRESRTKLGSVKQYIVVALIREGSHSH